MFVFISMCGFLLALFDMILVDELHIIRDGILPIVLAQVEGTVNAANRRMQQSAVAPEHSSPIANSIVCINTVINNNNYP